MSKKTSQSSIAPSTLTKQIPLQSLPISSLLTPITSNRLDSLQSPQLLLDLRKLLIRTTARKRQHNWAASDNRYRQVKPPQQVLRMHCTQLYAHIHHTVDVFLRAAAVHDDQHV